MVSGTRASRKNKEVNDDSRKKEIIYGKGSSRYNFRKTDVSVAMTASRETSFSREITKNSQSKQKSMRLDKPISPSTPRITNKSERLEKQSTPSPLRRSDRNKKKMSSSSNSKQSVKEFTSSNLSWEKDKTERLIQVLVDTENTESALESVGKKRKNMDARSFKSLFKRQQLKVVFPDFDRGLEGQDNISYICNCTSRESGCKPMRNGADNSDELSKRVVVKLRDQIDRTSYGDLHKSICCLRGCDAEILGNDARIDSNHIVYVVDEIPELCHGDGLKDRSNSSFIESYNDFERLPTNFLTATNTYAPVPQSSACLESSQYCAMSTENGEICLEMKEIIPSPSAKCETPSLLRTCVLCNKNKRCFNFCKDDDSLETLLCCTSIESTSDVSKFVEYWVPAQISNYQLELYCDALLNSNALRSSSRSDLVGALRDILLTVRKCCDHPYLVDTSIQKALFAEKQPAADILEIGIKASGKLHVLDLMLSEIKTRGLRVMIIFQMLVGPEGATIGDILDDFCRQRFGANTYERVDARVVNSRKQAAVDRFNRKETGQFVFLLENRACSSSIKLSSLDLVVIYDSDWNPTNDLRALRKISIDSEVEQIKVFRLYSSCTVEERALVLAKQNINIDASFQRLTGRVTYDTLLMWGASYLFGILDEYHAVSNSIDLRSLSGQLLLNEVIMEFHAMVSNNCDIFYINPLISKVTLHDGHYKSNSRNFGEAKVQLMDGVEPYIFWRNLLNRKNPQWKHLKGECPRNRKRAQCSVKPSRTLGCENGDASKKHKQAVNDNMDPSSVEENYTTVASNQFQPLPIENSTTNNNPNCMFGQSSFLAGVDTFESEERFLLLHKQKSLHSSLQVEVTRICQLLKISDDVVETARRFLEYVVKNHDARSDSPAIIQAFQISLCWVAASISKQKVDKKHSFLLAKQHLNYECTEEQVNSIYSKMQSLIRMYCSQNANDSNKDCLLADEVIDKEPSNASEGLPLNSSSCKLKKIKIDNEEELFNEEHHAAKISLHEKLNRMVKAAGNEIQDEMKKKMKKCEKRMKRLIRKQEEEVRELQRILSKQRVKLLETHKLESAVTRSIHDQGFVAIFKLDILDDNFAKKMEEHNLLKDIQLKDLKTRQLAAREEESRKASNWLAEAIACSNEHSIIKGPQTLGFQSNGDAGCSQGNYVAPSDPYTSAQAVTLGHNDPSATLYNLEYLNSDIEVGIMALERSPPVVHKQLDHLIHSYDVTRETGSANLPAYGELVSCKIQLEDLNKDACTEVLRNVSNEVVSRIVDNEVLHNKSNGGYLTGLPDSMVNQIDRPDEMADSGSMLNHLSENEIHRHLSSTEWQDREPAVEIPNTLHIEVATLELVDTSTVFPSNGEESTTGNHELLHDVVVDASLSCNHFHLSETEHPIQNRERNPFQSAATARENADLYVFISQSCEPSQLEDSHLDLGPSSRFNSDQSMEMLASSPNNTAITEAVVNTSELPNQAVQWTLDSGCLHGLKNVLVHPIQQVASWNSTPSSLAEPLEDEVERLRKEVEQLEKTHENVASQLRSDCEREMVENIAQIRSKYEAKIKDAEAEFRLKMNEVEKNRNIVLMNKKLAEAFRSKYVDFKDSRRPRMQEAFPSGFMPLPSTRLHSAASASQPSCQQTAAPFQQMLPHQPIPNSISSPVASLNVTTPPPEQAVPRTGPRISGGSSRPLVINGITSATNPHVSREIYSPAPHIQSFTPAAPPLVGGQIRSPAPHLHPFRSAAPPRVGVETRSQGSHFQPFRPPTSTALHQHLLKQKYRRLDELP